MAARRLIIVLLVLFAVSIVAAMIAPDRRGGLVGGRSTSSTESTTTTTTEAPEPPDALPPGEALTVRIEASAANPETVRASVGDQLALEVSSGQSRAIEIPAFGVTDDAAPAAPASFNLLLREPGRLPILDAGSGELVGRLDVGEPRRGNRAPRAGREPHK